MALNCIVDDSALLAGLGDSKDNLKSWVRDGSINLFVPLYTLTKLNQLKFSPPPTCTNAIKTLEWLDRITSATERKATGRVELQGPEDQYESWGEVEKWMLPDTPLSRDNLDGLTEELGGRLSMNGAYNGGASALRDASDSGLSMSPHSSPDMTEAALVNPNGYSNVQASKVNGHTSTAVVQENVRPLLNFVVWRTHHNDTTLAGSSKYILLTNDPRTQSLAQKFGVRAKLLAELNKIVRKGAAARKINGNHGAEEAVEGMTEEYQAINDDNEEVIVFNPSQRPGSSRSKPPQANLIDPNHFGRRAAVPPAPTQNKNPALINGHAASRTNARGNGFSPRGNGSPRGSGRGQFYSRGSTRGGVQARGQLPPQQLGKTKPIDPDSYARPSVTRGRGGGSGRKLFDPNGT